MENNTTGHYMETFIDMLKILVFSLSVMANILMFKRICALEDAQNVFNQKLADLNRSALSPREPDAKPIKPNNWDSVKEAFKGPVRINERN